MLAPCGVEIKLGQRWREADRRYTRVVTVIAIDEANKRVQIQWVVKTWARLDRFNGKSNGYKLEE